MNELKRNEEERKKRQQENSYVAYKRKVIGSADVISTIRREEILDFFYEESEMELIY